MLTLKGLGQAGHIVFSSCSRCEGCFIFLRDLEAALTLPCGLAQEAARCFPKTWV